MMAMIPRVSQRDMRALSRLTTELHAAEAEIADRIALAVLQRRPVELARLRAERERVRQAREDASATLAFVELRKLEVR